MTAQPGDLTLRRRLAEAQATIDALLSGQVDAVADARGTTPVLLAKAQDAMEQSRRRLQDIIDGLAPSIFVSLLTPAGIVTESNQPPLLGVCADDILGKPIESTFWSSDSPAGRQRLRLAVARAAQGEPSRYDAQVHDASGATIDIDFSLEPLRDAARQVVGMVASATLITERKEIETALRVSNENFHQLADNITDVFWIRSPDMRQVHYVSPGFDGIWGAPSASLQANPDTWKDFLHPDDRDRVIAQFDSLTADTASIDVEYRIVRPAGDERWIRSRGFQVRDSAQRLVRLTGIVNDITDRKNAEMALRESELNYRALVEWSPEPITVTRAGTFLFVNPAAVRLLGAASPGEMIGRSTTPFLHPDALPAAVERVRQITESGGTFPMTLSRLVKVDGTPIDVELQGRTISYHGEPAILTSIRDVTERQVTAAALHASIEEFRTLADAMPQMVWITQRDGANIYCNEQWTAYTGLTLEESYGSGWYKPFHPDDQGSASAAWEHAVATLGAYTVECRLRRWDGEYRWWLIRGVPHFDSAGTVAKWFGTCTDIHDLKLGELEISRSNRALRLLSGCGAVLIHAETEADLLDRFCRVAVDLGGYRLAWVGYANDDEGKTITPMAQAGGDDSFLTTIRITWKAGDPLGEGPSGRAIRSEQAIVWADIASAGVDNWSDLARRRGYHGAICLPLRNAERTFGVLTMYSMEAGTATPDELRLLQEVADNLAFGIGNQRAQAEQRRVQAAVLRVAAGVSASSGTEFYQHLVRNMADALGAQAAFVSRLVQPDALGGRTLAAVVDGKEIDNFDYAFAGTPCEQLSHVESVVITGGAAERFPLAIRLVALHAEGYVGQRLANSRGEVLGHLFVVFSEPLAHVDFITSTLRIFAARAASELERQDTDDRIREQAALLDIANEAITVRDMNGEIIYWNKGAERIFGWGSSEVLGRGAVESLGANPLEFAAAQTATVASGEWQGELVKRAKNGRSLTTEARWTLVRDGDGAPKSILAIETDITKRKALEAQFLRAQRMEGIGTLAGGIAHDLNNVLAPIMMSVELLKDLATNGDDLSLLDTLLDSATRGAALVQQVLSFARGVDGARIPVNPLAILRDLVKIMHDTFPKSITVELAPAREPWAVTGDPTQIHQVFLNLCVNARDAMPLGGRLYVAVENVVVDETYAALNQDAIVGAYVKVTVSDTGEGMSPQTRERIFEPFFTTKEVGKGTGLGLSTTIAIVKSHGGFIALTSELHHGTTFSVYLPADPNQTTAASALPAAPALPRGSGELILLVDDEEAVRIVAQQTLERFGYRVLVAAHGAEAVAMYATRLKEISVVVTDMAMPVMDGTATITALRSINPAVRIIGSSGVTTTETVARAGVPHFLAKPYTARSLLQLVHEVLHRLPAD